MAQHDDTINPTGFDDPLPVTLLDDGEFMLHGDTATQTQWEIAYEKQHSCGLEPSPDLLNEYHLYRKLHRRYVETGTLRFSSYLTIMGGLGLLFPIPHIIIGLVIALSSGSSFAINIGLLFLSVGLIMFYVLGVHFVQSWRLFKAPHLRMLSGQIIHVATIWNAKPTITYAFTSPSTGLEVTSTFPIRHASLLTAPVIGESVLILYANDQLFRLL